MVICTIEEDPYGKFETTKSKCNRIVAIDFGTTNSLAAYVNDTSEIEILKLEENNILLPSVFSIIDGIEIIGTEALKNKNNIKSIKRLAGKTYYEIFSNNNNNSEASNKIGNKFDWNFIEPKHLKNSSNQGDDNNIYLSINGSIVSVAEIISSILAFIKNRIKSSYISDWQGKIVLTVPAYFNEVSKSFIKDCAKIAGLDVIRILAEPTAAAMYYDIKSGSSQHGHYIVYDLGGGTFDISILETNHNSVRVIATGGDANMGGDDIDSMLFNEIHKQYIEEDHDELKEACAFIKKELSEKPKSSYQLKSGTTISISIEKFESIITKFIARSFKILMDTLNETGLSFDNINKCILVGGSTKIPYIQKGLQKIFIDKVEISIEPELAVVKGAALHADTLERKDGKVLIDVIPLSLGIELYGGIVEKIIERNSPIPASNTQQFTNCIDWQTSISISIWQGEREFLDKGIHTEGMKFLATFDIEITPKLAGMSTVDVTFNIDENGILNVIASYEEKQKNIFVNTKSGLSKEIIESMMLSFIQNDEQDIANIKNAKYKANILRCVELLKSNIGEHFIDDIEKSTILTMISECEKHIYDNFKNINVNIEEYTILLEDKVRSLLERKFDIMLNK